MFDTSKSILDEIKIDSLSRRGIRLFVKRDDLIDKNVSGNKWRKLKYNVSLCQSRKKEGVLTFGGAYSNHLLATASACNILGVKSIGVVRGDELNIESNETLRNCSRFGMKLIFVSRSDYQMRHEKAYHELLSYDYPNHLIVPEGGANYYGMIGCQEILNEINENIDHVFVAQGTSTTSAGILLGMNDSQQLHVVPVLKGYDSLSEMKSLFMSSGLEVNDVVEMLKKVNVLNEYHFGGYGKYTLELLEFIRSFYVEYGMKLDPIYTGKAMFALLKEIEKPNYNNSDVLFIHTGGLQGVRGVEERSGVVLFD